MIPHLTTGERALGSLLFGGWLVLTVAHVGMPPEWQDIRVANLAIGASVIVIVVTGVVMISRRQR